MASDIVRSENGVASETLGASLRRGPLVYRGGHTSDQSWVFEIVLPERAPIVAEAFVDNITGIRMLQDERAASGASSPQLAATHLNRIRAYGSAHGGIWFCEHLTLPWKSMGDAEMLRARRAFILLWFELECRWPDDPYLQSFCARVGDYILARLEFRAGPRLLHITASTAEVAP